MVGVVVSSYSTQMITTCHLIDFHTIPLKFLAPKTRRKRRKDTRFHWQEEHIEELKTAFEGHIAAENRLPKSKQILAGLQKSNILCPLFAKGDISLSSVKNKLIRMYEVLQTKSSMKTKR